MAVAGKTGTTTSDIDLWFEGYLQRLLTASLPHFVQIFAGTTFFGFLKSFFSNPSSK